MTQIKTLILRNATGKDFGQILVSKCTFCSCQKEIYFPSPVAEGNKEARGNCNSYSLRLFNSWGMVGLDDRRLSGDE